MLTKNDLLQIRGVIKEETGAAIEEQVRPIIREELDPVKQDISTLKGDVFTLKKGQKSIKRKLDTLHKDFHSFVDHSDKRLTKVEQDVKKLQQN